MSEYSDVDLVGPRGRNGVLRIYPERVQVRFEDLIAVGEGSLESLLASLQERKMWQGGNVVIVPGWLVDRTVVKMRPPGANEFTTLTGSRNQMINMLQEVFAANI